MHRIDIRDNPLKRHVYKGGIFGLHRINLRDNPIKRHGYK